jgi:hypothetical protein
LNRLVIKRLHNCIKVIKVKLCLSLCNGLIMKIDPEQRQTAVA